jgi:hypothetical protein
MAAWPVGFHPRVSAAEMAAVAAALPNRELRQTAFFLLSFYPRELRPNQRPMNWTFFQFDRRFSAGAGAHVRGSCRDIIMIVHVVLVGGFRARIFDGRCDADGDWYWNVDPH